jgi:GNAT superfamily N-acetyltransferase
MEGSQGGGFYPVFSGFSSVSMARSCWLNGLFVLPSHSRQGLGALLLDAAMAYGRAMGDVRI